MMKDTETPIDFVHLIRKSSLNSSLLLLFRRQMKKRGWFLTYHRRVFVMICIQIKFKLPDGETTTKFTHFYDNFHSTFRHLFN